MFIPNFITNVVIRVLDDGIGNDAGTESEDNNDHIKDIVPRACAAEDLRGEGGETEEDLDHEVAGEKEVKTPEYLGGRGDGAVDRNFTDDKANVENDEDEGGEAKIDMFNKPLESPVKVAPVTTCYRPIS